MRVWSNRRQIIADTFDDSLIEDGLFVYLVSALFASTAALYSSMIMGALIILSAWLMTYEEIFLYYLAINAIIGVARNILIYRYRTLSRVTPRIAMTFDRTFTFWSTLYALVLGLTAYSLLTLQTKGAETLAIGACVGFTMAFVNRSAARMRLLVLQIVGICAPAVYGYAVLPIENGYIFCVLLTGVTITTLIMGKTANEKLVELYRANDRNSRLARLDGLTGLMNRLAFTEALEDAMADGADGALALFMIDLDRFKEINDTLGHSAGDAVIIEMAQRIRRALRPDDILARLGGDEYVILKRCPDPYIEARDDAERLVEALAKPLTIDEMSLPASASIGVALYPEHARSGGELMKLADIALYEAKHRGRNTSCVFDASMQAQINDKRLIKREIQAAIDARQFEPWFQPILDIHTGRIIGYEALARWRHPTLGMIAPNRFIPLAEQSGSIFEIGEMIFEQACHAAASWPEDVTLAVNLSPVQFRRPEALVDMIQRALAKTGLSSSRLYVEITESLLIEDTPQTRLAIAELSFLGVRFSLDDFGAGYSSLSYIQQYPFSRIKIDKRFIDAIDSDKTSRAIVSAVLALAEGIGLDVVAEGVETRVQEAALLEIGVTQAQGYFYGKPAPSVFEEAPLKVVGM